MDLVQFFRRLNEIAEAKLPPSTRVSRHVPLDFRLTNVKIALDFLIRQAESQRRHNTVGAANETRYFWRSVVEHLKPFDGFAEFKGNKALRDELRRFLKAR